MNKIRELRTEKGLSQQKLADLLKISQQSVYKYENNLSEPDIQALKEMSVIFDTSIDYIVGNTANPRKNDFVTETSLTDEELENLRLFRKITACRKKLIRLLLEDYTSENQ